MAAFSPELATEDNFVPLAFSYRAYSGKKLAYGKISEQML